MTVLITDQAFADLDAITNFIKGNGSLEAARKWFAAIITTIETLRDMPGRCEVTEESIQLEREVRLLLHGRRHRKYKIYFAIDERTETVRVFHVRHWARKRIDVDELRELMDDVADYEGEE